MAPAEKLYAPVINDGSYGAQQVNVADQQSDPSSLWHALRAMIAARKAHPALSLGSFAIALPANAAILAYWRTLEDDRILVIANLSDSEQAVTFDLSIQ